MRLKLKILDFKNKLTGQVCIYFDFDFDFFGCKLMRFVEITFPFVEFKIFINKIIFDKFLVHF